MTIAIRPVRIFAFFLLLAVPVAVAEPVYRDLCEASAAIAIYPVYMIVARDDFQSLLAFERTSIRLPGNLSSWVTTLTLRQPRGSMTPSCGRHPILSTAAVRTRKSGKCFFPRGSHVLALSSNRAGLWRAKGDILTALQLPASVARSALMSKVWRTPRTATFWLA